MGLRRRWVAEGVLSRVLYKSLVHEVCEDRRDTWCGVFYADWASDEWTVATPDDVTCLACLATGSGEPVYVANMVV